MGLLNTTPSRTTSAATRRTCSRTTTTTRSWAASRRWAKQWNGAWSWSWACGTTTMHTWYFIVTFLHATWCTRYLDYTLEKEVRWLFLAPFRPILKQFVIFEAAGAVAKIGLSPKSNCQIKFIQVELFQIRNTHCMTYFPLQRPQQRNKIASHDIVTRDTLPKVLLGLWFIDFF